MPLTIEEIKTKIEELTYEFGGQGNVALTGQAYHGCYPNRPCGWDAPAIQIDGNMLRTGKAKWDFDEFESECEKNGIVIDDDAMYPWDNEFDFVAEEEFNIYDDDDLETLTEIFEKL